MARTYSFAFESALAAPAGEVWAHASSLRGVNRELGPLLRMTYPREGERLSRETVRLGERLFRSWIVLLGVIPIEYDDLTIVEMEDGRFFQERSAMGMMKEWHHRRTVTPTDGGCTVRDELAFVPRIPRIAPVQMAVFRRVFAHRHRRLRTLFGGHPNASARPTATGAAGPGGA